MSLGRTSQCKDCHRNGQKEYYNNWDYVREYQTDYVEQNTEKLQDYNKQYVKNKIEEDPEYFKKQYQRYQEHQIEYHAKRREDENYREYNKEYLREYNSDPKNIERRNEYWKNRYENDIHFKLHKTMGNRMRASLVNGKDNNELEELLGYSISDLIIHLESKFQTGMTWNNYGEWHIDHIVPVTYFEYTSYYDESFKKCWSLQNLQPMWADENLEKSDIISDNYNNVELAAQLTS